MHANESLPSSEADLDRLENAAEQPSAGGASEETSGSADTRTLKTLLGQSRAIRVGPAMEVDRISTCVHVAVDGKMSTDMQTWGVGMVDVGLGMGHFSGGPFTKCTTDILNKGVMDQATVEALALLMGIDWIRKRQKPTLNFFLTHGFRPIEMPMHFVTDRTAALVTMKDLGQVVPTLLNCEATGFRIVLSHVAVSLVKMLLITGVVSFRHKSADPSQASQSASAWALTGLPRWVWEMAMSA